MSKMYVKALMYLIVVGQTIQICQRNSGIICFTIFENAFIALMYLKHILFGLISSKILTLIVNPNYGTM